MEIDKDGIANVVTSGEIFAVEPNAADLCRLCANTDNQLIPIFKGEGLEHNIHNKIKQHLPIISVSESDELPLQVCYQCASTLISWHNLYEASLVADQRLRDLLGFKFDEDETFDTCDFIGDHSYESKSNVDESSNQTDKLIINVNPDVVDAVESIRIDEPVTESDNRKRSVDWPTFTHQSNVKRYNCAYMSCDNVYYSRRGIIRHVSLAHNSVPLKSSFVAGHAEFECTECFKAFACQIDKRTHMVRVHGEVDNELEVAERSIKKNTYKYCCQYCDKRFLHKHNLNRHEMVHEHPLESLPQCSLCMKTFSTKWAVNRHRRAMHEIPINERNNMLDTKRNVKCDQCNYVTYSRYKLLLHYRIHTGEKPFTCEYCGKQFRFRETIRTHLNNVHYRVKKFACEVCDKRFTHKKYLEAHTIIHKGERPYVCDECGKAFTQRSTLYTHQISHRHPQHKCHLCLKLFRYKSTFDHHLKRHRGELDFKCTQCDRGFVDKKYLRRHEAVHSDVRPFVCGLCGATFKLKRYLTQHDRSHIKKSSKIDECKESPQCLESI